MDNVEWTLNQFFHRDFSLDISFIAPVVIIKHPFYCTFPSF